MSTCTVCEAGLEWFGGTTVSPDRVESAYLCPNPDCEVSLIRVVCDE